MDEIATLNKNIVEQQPFDYSQLAIDVQESVKTKTTEIKILVKQTAQGIIDIGLRLIDIKASLGHGNWLPWLESEFGWGDKTARNFIKVAEKFKSEKISDLNFAPSALYLLSQNNTSEKVREEALERSATGEKITAKLAKEIKDRESKIKELEAKLSEKVTPNLDNLIPGLKRLINAYDGIPEKQALAYSCLDESKQRAILSGIESSRFLMKEIDELKTEKALLSESATKAHEKADEMQSRFDDAVDKSIQEILKTKDREIADKEKELVRAKTDIRNQLETSLRVSIEKEYQDEILKAREEKERAEKAKKQAQLNASDAYHRQKKLEIENKKLKKLANVASLVTIDNSYAKKIRSIIRSLEWEKKDLTQDIRKIGGGMKETRLGLEGLIALAEDIITEIDGQAVIDV